MTLNAPSARALICARLATRALSRSDISSSIVDRRTAFSPPSFSMNRASACILRARCRLASACASTSCTRWESVLSEEHRLASSNIRCRKLHLASFIICAEPAYLCPVVLLSVSGAQDLTLGLAIRRMYQEPSSLFRDLGHRRENMRRRAWVA